MSEKRYLVAHKVRGELAFDVAIQMTCPTCRENEPLDGDRLGTTPAKGCNQCEGEGFWWIIPTSGHRAHPVMQWELKTLCHYIPEHGWQPSIIDELGPIEGMSCWASTPEHYQDNRAPAPSRPAFLDKLLGNARPATPLKPIPRRGF